jgi:2-amino-4-hydroxy-6-hydroxymethyldihydropteridine diphosphokinase
MNGGLPHRAYLGLGANLGQRKRQLRHALALLHRSPAVAVRRVSGFIETEAVGGPPDQPQYLNGAAELRTSLSPHALLNFLRAIERRLGRVRSLERNAPRTIDLDLLLYDDRVIDEPQLTLPHPRIHERAFVLRPLCQLAPNLEHPVLRKPLRRLLAEHGKS